MAVISLESGALLMGRDECPQARQYLESCAIGFESVAAREVDPYAKAELLQQAAAYRKLCALSDCDKNNPGSGIGSEERSEKRRYLERCANGFESLAAREVDPYVKADLLQQAAVYRKLWALSDRDPITRDRGRIPEKAKHLSSS